MMNDVASESMRPAWREPYVWLVVGLPLAAVLACLVTAVFILRGPQALAAVDAGADLHASLRPYQQHGLRWLHLLSRLRLGACLADDMGLGKTIQVLALLLVRKRVEGAAPSLLVAPASLLANWAQEAA